MTRYAADKKGDKQGDKHGIRLETVVLNFGAPYFQTGVA
jgi:hypothetical protein